MAIQERNAELVDILKADFLPRNEPNVAWGNAPSMFLQLPGLRGLWIMSTVESGGNVADNSGHGHRVSENGDVEFGLDLTTARCLACYASFDGTGDYLYRVDEADMDVTGATDTFPVLASSGGAGRGLTCGGWFYPQSVTADQGLLSKWGAAGQRSWLFGLYGAVAGDPLRLYISDDGTNSDSVSSSGACVVNTWQFMAGRFNDADAGAELAVFLNDTKTTGGTARASIFNSTADFNISGYNSGTSLYTGRAAMCFFCAAAVPDVVLWLLYQHTRALFGV